MIRRPNTPTQFTLNEPPSPIRIYQLVDFYDNHQTPDSTAAQSRILEAVFGFANHAHEQAKVAPDYRRTFALWFNDIVYSGNSYAQTRQVTLVNEDHEIYKKLHILTLGWSGLTRVTERQGNFSLANYLCLTYTTNQTQGNNSRSVLGFREMIYSRMSPVLAGTMLQNQGYATQNNLVHVSKPNPSQEILRVDVQSSVQGIPALIRDQIFRQPFYQSHTAWGFGLEGLTYYADSQNIALATYATNLLYLSTQFGPKSMKVPNIDLLNTVPLPIGRPTN